MSNPGLSDDELMEAVRAVESCATQEEAARQLGIGRSTIQNRIMRAKERGLIPKPHVELPDFGDDDISIERIIDHQAERFRKRYAHKQKQAWFPVRVNIEGPIGITWFGDPHVDDDGCNWPLLKEHIAILNKTPALFAGNIGDTTNNWVGRLRTLFANQEMSQSTAYKLARWFLLDSGVKWLVWLLGNHDLWNDGAEVFRQMGAQLIGMENEQWPDTKISTWQARMALQFPDGNEHRIWAAHSFPGNSIWNSLHGLQRAAHTKAPAHVYVAGHTHNWAIHQEESASRDFTYWLVRARGYKYIDTYGENLGHFPQKEGAAVTTIHNPKSTSQAGQVQAFADLEAAADYLTWLRSR